MDEADHAHPEEHFLFTSESVGEGHAGKKATMKIKLVPSLLYYINLSIDLVLMPPIFSFENIYSLRM